MLPELWSKIFEKQDCETILNVKLTCRSFNKICLQDDLYIKRKFRSFPRLEGACSIVYHTDNWVKNSSSREEIIKFLNMRRNNIINENDICRGDLIYFMIGGGRYELFFFDGDKVIDHDGNLPDKLRIINDNVPINYWDNTLFKYCTKWFDSTFVQQQCINNVSLNLDMEQGETKFNYNGKTYTMIYFANTGEKLSDLVDHMKNILLSFTLLRLIHLDGWCDIIILDSVYYYREFIRKIYKK